MQQEEFWEACKRDRVSVVSRLIGQIDINKKDPNGDNALLIACKNDCMLVVERLLKERDLDVNATDKNGEHPLVIACNRMNATIAGLLVSNPLHEIDSKLPTDELLLWQVRSRDMWYMKNTDLEVKRIRAKDDEERELETVRFFYSCLNGDTERVECVLMDSGKKRKLELSFYDPHRLTPLAAAVEGQHTQVVRLLLEHRKELFINVNYWGEGIGTAPPLHVACIRGYLEIFKMLLECEETSIDQDEVACFDLAVRHERYEMLELLVQSPKFWEYDYNYADSLLDLYSRGKTELVHKVLQKHNLDMCDREKTNLLHLACSRGYLGLVKTLCELGFDVNAYSRKYNTPIHIACTKGHIEIAEFLLTVEGIDIEIDDGRTYSTPLRMAVQKKDLSMVKLLVNKGGANVNDISDPKGYRNVNAGETILFEACAHESLEIIEFLVSTGKLVHPKYEHGSDGHPMFKVHPLFYSFASRNVEILRLLLDETDAPLNPALIKGLIEGRHAIQMICLFASSRKGVLDSESQALMSQSTCADIRELGSEYLKNEQKTRELLRYELGWTKDDVARLYFYTRLVLCGLFRIKVDNPSFSFFFRIATALPSELVCTVCNSAYGVSGFEIKQCDVDKIRGQEMRRTNFFLS